jgi:uncharacterized membrane protein
VKRYIVADKLHVDGQETVSTESRALENCHFRTATKLRLPDVVRGHFAAYRKIANASHPADHRNLRQIAKRGSAACVEEAASQGARNLLSERSDIREVAQAMPGGDFQNRTSAPPATEATDLPPAPVIAPSPATTATTASIRQAPIGPSPFLAAESSSSPLVSAPSPVPAINGDPPSLPASTEPSQLFTASCCVAVIGEHAAGGVAFA